MREERCGKWMPLAKAYCARPPHDDPRVRCTTPEAYAKVVARASARTKQFRLDNPGSRADEYVKWNQSAAGKAAKRKHYEANRETIIARSRRWKLDNYVYSLRDYQYAQEYHASVRRARLEAMQNDD